MVRNTTCGARRWMVSNIILACSLVMVGACGSSTSSTPATALKLTNGATLGSYLTTGDGKTLYYYAKDLPGAATRTAVSNCNGGCLAAWPIYHFDGTPAVEGIDAADVSDFTRPDGAKQSTYQGWPLYYFASDSSAGDTKGEGVNNIWFVLRKPAYSEVILENSAAGIYLADGLGMTLYAFSKDTTGTPSAAPISACTSATCLANWPVFLAEAPVLPSILDPATFTTFTRSDGPKQSAYKGHPLYYYSGDAAPGDTKGRGLSAGAWDTLDPTAP